MLKYPCLVLDHDDTVVRSEQTVNFPEFQQTLARLRPGVSVTLADFTRGCYRAGYAAMCREVYGFSDEELAQAFASWKVYVRTHIPPAYDGMREIILEQKRQGGIICVVSHSADENITRDYKTHFGVTPDFIYGWELGDEKRKPSPYSLLDIMEKTGYPATQLLMVDDLKSGCDMARACSVPFACAGWSHDLPEIEQAMRASCEHYFQTVGELARFLFL